MGLLWQNWELYLHVRGLRCSWDGLALLDSILPSLLVQLERCLTQAQQSDAMTSEQEVREPLVR